MDSNTQWQPELLEQTVALVTQQFAALLASHPEYDSGDMEQQMRQLLQIIGERALGESFTAQDEPYPDAIPCSCGGEAGYLMRRQAQTLTVFGWVHYRRAYHLCPDCHHGQSPLDQRLGLRPGQVSLGLEPLLGLLGIQTAFDEASRLAQALLHLTVSDNTIRKVTQAIGRDQAAQEAAWSAQAQDPAYLRHRQRRRRPPRRLYGSIDGVLVPVEDEWRELKVGTWYEVTPVSRRQWPSRFRQRVGELEALKAHQISYFCDISEPDAFSDLLWATGCQRRADQAQEVVFVADGAKWIWKVVERNFPKAVQIVDWYHAVSYLSPIATALFAAPAAADQWRQTMSDKLWHSQLGEVIEACVALANHPKAGEAALKAATYYANNCQRMNYAAYRRQGYLIGSGTVESGGKQIATARLKRSGARWTLAGAVATAKARAAWLSHQWPPPRNRCPPLASAV
jgi:hypothetical protein